MVSYSWAQQEIVLKIVDKLKKEVKEGKGGRRGEKGKERKL